MFIRLLVESELGILKEFTPLHWSGDVFETFKYHFGKPYFYPVVAVLDSSIVGCAYGLLHADSGWISNVVVLPKFRGQGIGTVLVTHLMDHLQSTGCTSINLCATHEGEFLYRKLGFSTRSTYTLLKRERSILDRSLTKILRILGSNFYRVIPSFARRQLLWRPTPHIRRAALSDYEEILNIDQQITGEKRKSYLLQFLSSAWVYQDDDNSFIRGFYIEGFGNNPILALDLQSGLEILQFKIGRGSENICVPSANQAAINFLLNLGFKVREIQPRMTIGREVVWHPEGIFNRGSGTG